jgi:phosphopantothenoylcysteine decarboxylase/phosphopantothenate--cysteine ligase
VQGRVVLGVSGGIAAYKSIEILRELVKLGCTVRVIMTRHATELAHPRTFAVLSGHPVEVDQWDRPAAPGVNHVELSHWADLLLIAPATANILAKMAAAIADDALTTYHLAHRRTVAVAPAMNTVMWHHAATRQSIDQLRQRGVTVIEPASGMLACGDEGEGRLAPVPDIVDQAVRLLPPRGPFAGLHVLISAGPTREPIDRVRFISNRSSGRMGVALAAAARQLGARVTLLHGPLSVDLPAGIDSVAVETAEEMGQALERLAGEADVALLAAAVADFKPVAVADGKLDRREGETSIELAPVDDLAARIGARAQRPYLVVFSAEVGLDQERAVTKMKRKGADAVVVNDIAAPGVGMEADHNEVCVRSVNGIDRLVPRAEKSQIAREILLCLSAEILARRSRA